MVYERIDKKKIFFRIFLLLCLMPLVKWIFLSRINLFFEQWCCVSKENLKTSICAYILTPPLNVTNDTSEVKSRNRDRKCRVKFKVQSDFFGSQAESNKRQFTCFFFLNRKFTSNSQFSGQIGISTRDLLSSRALFILLNSKLIVACAHEAYLFDRHWYNGSSWCVGDKLLAQDFLGNFLFVFL